LQKAELHSCIIITVPGNSPVHKLPASRMPVILPKGRESDWLKSSKTLSEILGMLEIFPAERMNTYPLAKKLNYPVHTLGVSCIQ
jgi:putative SOS response-associated peptidase YedK